MWSEGRANLDGGTLGNSCNKATSAANQEDLVRMVGAEPRSGGTSSDRGSMKPLVHRTPETQTFCAKTSPAGGQQLRQLRTQRLPGACICKAKLPIQPRQPVWPSSPASLHGTPTAESTVPM